MIVSLTSKERSGDSIFGVIITGGYISSNFTKYASDIYQVHPFAIID